MSSDERHNNTVVTSDAAAQQRAGLGDTGTGVRSCGRATGDGCVGAVGGERKKTRIGERKHIISSLSLCVAKTAPTREASGGESNQAISSRMTISPSSREKKSRRPLRAPLLPQKHCDDDDDGALDHGFCGASFSGAVFNLSTTIVGAGIMALPATMRVLGLIPGLAMIVVAGILAEMSIDMILRFGRSSKATSASYSGVVGDAFGGVGRAILQTCIVVNNLGMLVVYMIIIGDVLAGTSSGEIHHMGVIEGWFGRQWWTTRFFLLLLTTFLVFAPLISFKRVDSLRYTSAVSVALALVFVVITAGVATVKLMSGSIAMPRLLPTIADPASFWKLFTTVPVLVTAYICHYSVHPIENELKDPSQMKSIVRSSMMLCSSVYVATSFFGFLLFGDQTMDDVLANFDGDLGIPYSSLLNDIVRISYAVHLMLVFPIVFFSLRLNLDGLLFPYLVPIAFDNRRFFSITVAIMGLSFVGATLVPSIWDAFQITGATAAIAIGFIFPAAIVLRDSSGTATKGDRFLSWVMIILAVASSTVAISSDIYAAMSIEGEIRRQSS
ncbi:Amino acid transporter avt6a [Asimina triloba]